jgi:hypothetical protein
VLGPVCAGARGLWVARMLLCHCRDCFSKWNQFLNLPCMEWWTSPALVEAAKLFSSTVIVAGSVVGYIPQAQEIARTQNAEGFSTGVSTS